MATNPKPLRKIEKGNILHGKKMQKEYKTRAAPQKLRLYKKQEREATKRVKKARGY